MSDLKFFKCEFFKNFQIMWLGFWKLCIWCLECCKIQGWNWISSNHTWRFLSKNSFNFRKRWKKCQKNWNVYQLWCFSLFIFVESLFSHSFWEKIYHSRKIKKKLSLKISFFQNFCAFLYYFDLNLTDHYVDCYWILYRQTVQLQITLLFDKVYSLIRKIFGSRIET